MDTFGTLESGKNASSKYGSMNYKLFIFYNMAERGGFEPPIELLGPITV